MSETNEVPFKVERRGGKVVPFDAQKIAAAIAAAFLRDADGRPRHLGGNELLPAERAKVQRLTDQVVAAVTRRPDTDQHPIRIEEIQDQVELALMRDGEHAVARDYVLYRERRRQLREQPKTTCNVDGTACEACQ